MVEMLGALAIMGILTMTGVWAYNAAMDKLRADTLINEAQKRAVNVAGQIGLYGRTNPSLGEFNDNTFGGGTFSTTVTTNGLYQQFGIQVSGVSKRVCQNILSSIDASSPIRRLSDTTSVTVPLATCTDNNTFVIVYNNDLSSGEKDPTYCENVNQCKTSCAECTNGACVGECEIPTGSCITNNDCNQHNECLICDTESGICKDGCQRVKYLESTGTQYIDTGIIPEATTGINVDYAYTVISSSVSAGICGTYQSNNPRTDALFVTTNSGMTNSDLYLIHGGNSIATQQIPAEGSFYNAKINWLNNGKLILGNISGDIGNNTPNSTPVRLFSRYKVSDSTYAYTKARIKKCQFSRGGEIIRDFIPMHAPFKTDGKQNCMFDRVSGGLFCNAGTGDFVVP